MNTKMIECNKGSFWCFECDKKKSRALDFTYPISRSFRSKLQNFNLSYVNDQHIPNLSNNLSRALLEISPLDSSHLYIDLTK